MAKVIVTGDKAVDKALRSLEPKLANKLARKTLRSVGKKVKGYASANLHASPSIQSGVLDRGLKVRSGKRSRNKMSTQVTTTAGTHDDPGYGGAQLEFGARHMPPEPFMRPAVYDHETELRGEFITDLRAVINEASKG